MKSKAFLLAVAILFAGCIVVTPSCFSQTVSEEAQIPAGMGIKDDGTPLYVGYMANELASEWMTINTRFVKTLIERAGGKVTIFNADLNTAKEIAGMEDMIQTKPDAIIIHATNSRAIIPGVEKATKAGIQCFTVDQLVYSDDIVCHVGIDQERVGALDAEYLIKRFEGRECRILEIQGQLGTFQCELRSKGFRETIKGHDNMKIVAAHVCDWRNDLSMNATMDSLERDPNINAIFTHSDCMLDGIVQALAQKKRQLPKDDPKYIVVTSVDATPESLNKLRKGIIEAVSENNCVLYADIVSKAIITKIVLGQDIPKEINVDARLITKENIDSDKNWGNWPAGDIENWSSPQQDFFPTPKR